MGRDGTMVLKAARHAPREIAAQEALRAAQPKPTAAAILPCARLSDVHTFRMTKFKLKTLSL